MSVNKFSAPFRLVWSRVPIGLRYAVERSAPGLSLPDVPSDGEEVITSFTASTHPLLEILSEALDMLDHPATDSTSNRLVAAAEAIEVAVVLLRGDPRFEFERHDLTAIMSSLCDKADA